jgi:hypothetical protein
MANSNTMRSMWSVVTPGGMRWIRYNIPAYWRTGTADDQKIIRALASPGLLAEMEHALGPYPDGIDQSIESDRRRVPFNVYLLEKKKPRLHFAWLAGLDHAQHEHLPLRIQAHHAPHGGPRSTAARLGDLEMVIRGRRRVHARHLDRTVDAGARALPRADERIHGLPRLGRVRRRRARQ